MNAISNLGGGLFDWVLQSTWQASVLVGFILLAQFLLRRQLSPAWRCGLWLLLAIRLLMPASPQSALSIFNLARIPQQEEPVLGQVPADAMVGEEATDRFDATAADPDPLTTGHIVQANRPAPSDTPVGPVGSQPTEPVFDWPGWLIGGWALGVCAFAIRLIASHIRFRRRLARERQPRCPQTLAVLDECRVAMGIRQPVRPIETPLCNAPAVFGLLDKRLLLPTGIRTRFSGEELRHIFLHELAHLKRRDLEINCIFAALLCLHWFNPVLWFAFARMRSDREIATDSLALSVANETDSAPYGETILKALEGLANRPANPGLVGIAETRNRIEQRIRAITAHGTRRHWRSLAIAATAIIACLTLTDAATEPPVADRTSPTPAAALEDSGVIDNQSSTSTTTPQSITISGTVTDANSGEPIPEFNVSLLRGGKVVSIEGDSFVGVGPRYVWVRTIGRDGQFAVKTDTATEDEGFQVRISSINHFPEISRIVSPQYLEELNMELRTGTGARGRVLLPDGSPAARLPIFMSGIEDSVEMDRPGVPDPEDQDCPVVFTDGDGSFRFHPADEEFSIVAFNELGYAEVPRHDPNTPYEIRLQPYGRIEGTLMVGGKPASGESVRLQNFEHFLENDARDGREIISFSQSAITDINGRFRFDKVPPGWCSVTSYRVSEVSRRNTSAAFPVDVQSGQTSTVTVGEKGRSVHGSAIVSDYEGEVDWRDAHATLNNARSVTEIPLRSEQSEFWTSKEGRETFRRIKSYPLVFGPDGSFQINDVPPGTYDLNLSVYLGNPNRGRVTMIGDLPFVGRLFRARGDVETEPIKNGRLKMEVVIPESDNDDDYAPFDLGLLQAEYVDIGNPFESPNSNPPNADEEEEKTDPENNSNVSASSYSTEEQKATREKRYERYKSENKIVVAGAVLMPRPIQLAAEKPLTILEAIEEAGGFSKTANGEKIRVLRGSEPERVFAENELKDEHGERSGFVLQAGDIIIIEERSLPAGEEALPTAETPDEKAVINDGSISVTGAVVSPQRIQLPEAGRISILDAITAAGGLSQNANRNKIRLLRRGEPERILSERELIRSFSEGTDPDLEPGDIVLVEESFL